MHLNTLQPGVGSKRSSKRVGRGIGSGLGKTCGRGHKGQKSRSGGRVAVGFEGGQMPLQRRLPKVGFRSRKARLNAEVRLHELARVKAEVITLSVLQAEGILPNYIQQAKVILSGELERAVKIQGLRVTQGARAAIEALGGTIED